ncbi:MAG: hypothetical protein FWE85_01700 [Clostridiales bacterium]|nr:hypothetical protein [Clostridiales bacterium]
MKRVICALLTFSMLVFLASCASDKTANTIQPMKLTAGQQEIIGLLSVPNTQELMIFEFNSAEAYSETEFWLEVYRDGEMIGGGIGLHTYLDSAEKLRGRLAVIISRNEANYQWTLSLTKDGGSSSVTATSEIIEEPALARVYGPMSNPEKIGDGKEIILYASLFSTESSLPVYSYQTLQEHPELLEEYAYAYLIKCRFTK